MLARKSHPSRPSASASELKDLFELFPDLPWPRAARPAVSDQILIARWRARQSRRAGLRTLAANEAMAALVRSRRL